VTLYAELPPIEADAPEPPRRWSRRRIVLTVIIGGLVAAIIGTGIGALVYANTYQPIGSAGFSTYGPVGPDTIRTVTDGLQSHTYILVGPVGTKGVVDYTVANNGPFDIRLLPPPGDSHLTYRWSPPTIRTPNGSGRSANWSDTKPVPMTWKSHQVIQLYVIVTKPGCASGFYEIMPSLPLRWVALGVHHTTAMWLDPENEGYPPIALCFPKSALKNVERF